jgi:hypothetical protein
VREDWPFLVGLGRLLRQDAALARVFGTSDVRGEGAAAAAAAAAEARIPGSAWQTGC